MSDEKPRVYVEKTASGRRAEVRVGNTADERPIVPNSPEDRDFKQQEARIAAASNNPMLVAAQEAAVACAATLNRAGLYYDNPLTDPKLKKPLDQLHIESGSKDTIGQWVVQVPRLGDIASCKNKDGGRSI